MSSSTVGLVFIILLTMDDNGSLVTSESVKTSGSVQIQESAGVALIASTPLQLVLSGGLGGWVNAGEPNQSNSGSATDQKDALIGITESGFYPSAAGEVISVSVRNEKVSTSGGGHPFSGTLIAQFN